MSSQRPLIADNRPSSEHSAEDANEEEALLNGEALDRDSLKYKMKSFWTRWKDPLILGYAAVMTGVVLVLATLYAKYLEEKGDKHHKHGHGHGDKHGDDNMHNNITGKRNLIFMVSDGMGPTSLEMTRSFRQYTDGLPINDILTLDKHIIGTSRTRSSNSLVTDSAAGATAFSCAMKSYNGAIAMLPDGTPCGTVLEAAKLAGYMTGLVVTTRLTDATPACFSAHVRMRWEEDRIAEQQIGDYPLGRMVDLMFGGGRCHFLPNTTDGSCRADNRDVVAEAKKNGWNYYSTREEFNDLKKGKTKIQYPLLGLFANTDIPYEIDRDDKIYPSLDEMAQLAVKALTEATKDTKQGFFILIEGSRIDHAGHGNDPAAQVHEVLAYDKAFKSAIKYAKNSKVPSLIVSTSDHETGGLAAARQLHATYPDYLWYPSVLANSSASGEKLSQMLLDFESNDNEKIKKYITKTLLPLVKITDATDAEINSLVEAKLFSAYIWSDMVSRRAQIGWSTHGHSGVDVNIYAYPRKMAKELWGNHENTEIGDLLREYLDVDVEAVTKKLKDAQAEKSWTGRTLEEILEMDKKGMGVGGAVGEVTINNVAHYHGDHRRCLH